MERISSLSLFQRPIQVLNTPSPSRKKHITRHDADHDYATASVCRRMISSSFTDGEDKDHSTFLSDLSSCSSLDQAVTVIFQYPPARELIEKKMLQDINSALQTLCTFGDYGSILSVKTDDERLVSIPSLVVDELKKRVPFLYKTLVVASTTTSSKDEYHLFVIYCMIMYQRNQRMNVVQRLLTALCIRHHAGNQVI